MPTPSTNDPFIKEVRENYDYAHSAWSPIYDEGDEDIKCVAGDPWDKDERKDREDNGRLCLSLDELNQYCNQAINDARQKQRSIKVKPRGNGANDKSAEYRAARIRAIEYENKAQSVYITAFENSIQRSYGFFGIGVRFKDGSFDQEIYLRRFANPNAILIDPDFKELDTSDKAFSFVVDTVKKDKFKRDYPGAKIQDFTTEHMATAPKWVKEQTVQVAEYWKVKSRKDTLFLLDDGSDAKLKVYQSELPKGVKPANSKIVLNGQELPILRSREAESKKVCQYLTNGLEVLKEVEWLGKWIPIIPVFGKELWITEGGSAKRKLMSLIRLARDPYMLYCYYRTQEAEEAQMTPKVPWIGYEGQFEGHEDEWANAHRVPIGMLQGKAKTQESGETILPLPNRVPFQPNFVAYETACEGARRAIQAAMGIATLPTAAQRRNEKSGVALEKIEEAQDRGSYHFTDNFEMGIEFGGRQIDDLLTKIEDSERDVQLRHEDESYEVVKLQPTDQGNHYLDPETNQAIPYDGDHDVTIATGQSFQSQRDAADDFVDGLLTNLKGLPIPPELGLKLTGLAIRLKNLGPIGDQMADLMLPDEKEQLPPQAQKAIADRDKMLQALNAHAEQMEAKIAELEKERDAKVLDNQAKIDIAKIQEATKITVAEIGTKAQIESERMKWENAQAKTLIDVVSTENSQTREQQFAREQQASDQAHASDTLAATQAHEAAQAASAAQQAGA